MKTLLLALCLALTACTNTVVPKTVIPSQPSMDQSYKPGAKEGEQEANSGFIGYTKGGNGLITPHARDRYNGLVEKYGNRFLPPLTKDAGVKPSGDVFEIDAQHLAKFITMNRWRKEGK